MLRLEALSTYVLPEEAADAEADDPPPPPLETTAVPYDMPTLPSDWLYELFT